MKTTLLALSALAAICLFFACKQTQYSTENLPDHQLRWGNGGGYVGRETIYTLLDNGQLFIRQTGGSLAEQGSVKPKKAKAMYDTMQALDLMNVQFEHPGNIYSFIEVLQDDNVRRISWGEKDHPVDARIADLYRQLNELIK
ncbi:MAG: hypothetical protein KDC61_09060 [Saprospiraceae bacterium]|nr:hypothetical protein [Saprospiraceae bacterium]MCB0574698.1 hypothetical protein [Saprospiraceae bacterium]MCB9356773.1 hypothetical protein [Lewinellaceae bacterium]